MLITVLLAMMKFGLRFSGQVPENNKFSGVIQSSNYPWEVPLAIVHQKNAFFLQNYSNSWL